MVQLRRVVVTGLGALTPCGLDMKSSWDALLKGTSGIGPITLFDPSDQVVQIAGEVKDFEPANYMDKKEARRMDRFMQLGMAASRQAYDDAGLSQDVIEPERFSVVIGTGSGGIGTIESQLREVFVKGPRRCSPFFIPMMISDLAAGRVSIAFNAQGPNFAIVTACATGADSIGNAFRMIQHGESDISIAGGTEAGVTPMSVAGFASAKAMTGSFNDRPTEASRPFDKGRDGFVMAEGACVMILEELSHAQKRGARIYAELVGYGRSSDAFDIVSPPPDGRGAVAAMRGALRDSELTPEDIGYVNAHATSTPVGDIAESKAVQTVFTSRADKGELLVSSTKSMTGHMLGAAGSFEAALCIYALQEQIVPPTMNVEEQDPECKLDVVANAPRRVQGLKATMSNSFGFGGHNASLIFKTFEG